MKNLKNYLVVCIFLLPFALYSQIRGQGGLVGNDNSYISPGSGMATINGTPVDYDKNRYEGVKGDPMLYKDWGKGFVVTRDTTNKQENVRYNFDGYANELHIRYPDGRVIIPYNYQIGGFQIMEDTTEHIFRRIAIQDKDDARYYEVIYYSTQYEIYKWHVRQLVKANLQTRGSVEIGKAYDEIVASERYFIRIKRERFVPLKKLTQSNLEDALPQQKEQIAQAIKALKLSKRLTETELKLLLRRIETMPISN